MWIFLVNAGFFSVVLCGDAPDQFVVRARTRDDLVRLRQLYLPRIKVIATPTRDYPFRALVTKQEWSQALARAAMDIDAVNFKSRTAEVLGHARAAVYGKVWSVLLELQRSARSE